MRGRLCRRRVLSECQGLSQTHSRGGNTGEEPPAGGAGGPQGQGQTGRAGPRDGAATVSGVTVSQGETVLPHVVKHEHLSHRGAGDSGVFLSLLQDLKRRAVKIGFRGSVRRTQAWPGGRAAPLLACDRLGQLPGRSASAGEPPGPGSPGPRQAPGESTCPRLWARAHLWPLGRGSPDGLPTGHERQGGQLKPNPGTPGLAAGAPGSRRRGREARQGCGRTGCDREGEGWDRIDTRLITSNEQVSEPLQRRPGYFRAAR